MQERVPWLVAGRYEVGEVVGKGGYGMVCRGVDRQTGRAVAMKMLSPASGQDPHVVERMLREQQAMLAMAGTCAVTAVDLCRLNSGAPCLVMEWLDGCDLEQQLGAWEAAGERPSSESLLAILRPVAETLHRAHEIGIVHRDIKPANIFLTTSSAPALEQGVRLLDFGLSRMKSAAPLTAAGMVMGSPSYIAPETWRGNSALIDHRADLYSLAVIVFRWLAGEPPFDTPNLIDKMTLVTTAERPSLRTLRPDLPAAIDGWLARGLAIEPVDRFQSGRELYRALAAALGAEGPADAELSGVRAVVAGATAIPAEKRSALSAAWGAATSLLRRFTGQRDSQPPILERSASLGDAPVPSGEAGEVATAATDAEEVGDRSSVWLDASDLEESPESMQPAAPAASPSPEAAESASDAEEPARGPFQSTRPEKSKAKAKSKAVKRERREKRANKASKKRGKLKRRKRERAKDEKL